MGRGAVVVLMLMACSGGGGGNSVSDGAPRPDAPLPDAGPPLFDVPLVAVSHDLDILFVVDDSGAMLQEQEALVNALPGLYTTLAELPGGVPGLHIGIVSSNVGTGPDGGGGETCAGNGDDGVMQVSDSCPALTDGGRYISDVVIDEQSGTREFNYTGDLVTNLGCQLRVRIQGCGFEQHLESMRRALANQVENADFVRPDATLVVIIVADEDDCSAADRSVFDIQPGGDTLDSPLGEMSSFRCFEFGVACDGEEERALGPRTGCEPDEQSSTMASIHQYAADLLALKGSRQVMVATITGPPAPVSVDVDPDIDVLRVAPACVVCPDGSSDCSTSPSEPDGALTAGFPGIRLRAFASAFPIRAEQSICSYAGGDLDFQPAVDAIGRQMADQTVTRCLIETPVDHDPDVEGIQPWCEAFDVPQDPELPIRSCEKSAAPCFQIGETSECQSGLELIIDRADSGVPVDTSVVLRCAE